MPSRFARLALALAAIHTLSAAACGDDSTAIPTTTTASGDGDGDGGRSGDGGAGSTTTGDALVSSASGVTSTASSGSSSSASSASSSGSTGSGGSGGGFASCGIGMDPGTGSGGGAPGGRVRVVAANLSSGDLQSYDGGQGVRILQGIDADIVLMQEMNRGSSNASAIGILVDDVCDGECNYIRGPQAQIPNGVLSRLPILECGSWVDPEVDNRNFVWARVDVPGDADLWAISVHLLTESASKRADEVDALLDRIADAIPATDLIVLGGDLNTNARSESAISKLAARFVTDGPHPADQDGNQNTNAPRDKPYDWVLADDGLFPFQVPVEIGASTFGAGAVIDTRVYDPISEIAPAMASDSDASGMQHMAVVKDFVIAP